MVAATRALATWNEPDSGELTRRPRHLKLEVPGESTGWRASERRTGTSSPGHPPARSAPPGVVHVDHRRVWSGSGVNSEALAAK